MRRLIPSEGSVAGAFPLGQQGVSLPVVKRVMAIDWSGALDLFAQRRGIWVADCSLHDRTDNAHPVAFTLRSGESRAAVETSLLTAAAEDPALVAGLDFSFSYPSAFLNQLGCADAFAFWDRVAAEGESWLTSADRRENTPHAHFWGRAKGSRQPSTHLAPAWLGYRQTELAAKTGSVLPRSSFQIGGAGAVGTGSLRGIPMLPRLRRAGFHIWPFDPPRLPLLVEIYPRLLTGPVIKSSTAARTAYLARPEFTALPAPARAAAESSEDAFDALISAWQMRQHAAEWPELTWPPDPSMRLEGTIWRPKVEASR